MKFTNEHSKKEFFVRNGTLVLIEGLREWVHVFGVDEGEPCIIVHERNGFGETINLIFTKEKFIVSHR